VGGVQKRRRGSMQVASEKEDRVTKSEKKALKEKNCGAKREGVAEGSPKKGGKNHQTSLLRTDER